MRGTSCMGTGEKENDQDEAVRRIGAAVGLDTPVRLAADRHSTDGVGLTATHPPARLTPSS